MVTKLNKLLLDKHNKYAIVNPDNFSDETAVLNKVAEMLNSGIDTLELNAVNLTSRQLLQLSAKIRELTAVFGALFLIYDRIDIAKLVEADGICLDENSISILNARKLIENSMLIGYKCKNSEQILSISDLEPDFLIVNANPVENVNIKQFLC